MSREQLAAEAQQAGRNAIHNLMWMGKHPDRYDRDKHEEMVAYLLLMIRFANYEMKNARRPGRTSVGSRTKELLFSILPIRKRLSKGDISLG
ncbi:hypothetical protein [Paenibacillus sp. OV219]|uniref:hypothetical protein n=1 Tax=Paenibacillus sp. OV219 TaxID=1884377 RepID=UPI000B88B01B|nr:hypothetical protein [Paenibacillus sp. OV219]